MVHVASFFYRIQFRDMLGESRRAGHAFPGSLLKGGEEEIFLFTLQT
jgi:hypothetical protein